MRRLGVGEIRPFRPVQRGEVNVDPQVAYSVQRPYRMGDLVAAGATVAGAADAER